MRQKWVLLLFIILLTCALILTTVYSLTLVYQSRTEIQKQIEPANMYPMLYHIAVLVPESADPFIIKLKSSIEKLVTANSGAVEFLSFPMQEAVNSFSFSSRPGELFKLALNANVDGIIMFFNNTEHTNSYAELALTAETPFTAITLDSIRGNLPLYSVSSNSYLHGKFAVQEAVSALGGSARIGVILPYTKIASSVSDDFLTGIHTALLEQGKGKVQAIAYEGDPRLGGEEAGYSLLINHPSVNVIICSTAQTSMSTAQLLIDKGLVGKVLLIGADENSEILRLLDKGVFKALIVRDADAIGKTAIELIMKQIQKTGKQAAISIKPIIKTHGN